VTGLFLSAWRLVLKRAASDGLIVAAAFVTVLLATTLLAAGPIYSDSVALSGLRRTLVDAPVQDRGIEVSARITAERYRSVSSEAVTAIEQTIGAPSVYRSGLSDSFALPKAHGRPHDALAVFAFYEGLESHAELVSGEWPGPPRLGAVQAVVPNTAARELGLVAGDEFVVAATADPSRTVRVEVSGTYQIDNPRDVFWWASPLETQGVQTVNFTTFGPFVVAEDSFYGTVADEARARWRSVLPVGRLSIDGLGALRDRLSTLDDRLGSARDAPNYTVAGGLGSVLERADRALLVARSGVLIPSVQLGVLAAAALLFLAGLLAERRVLESAVIRSRGAGGDKVAALATMEGALLALPAALAAPWLAALCLRVLNHVGPLAAIDLDLNTHVNRESYILAFLAALACIAALSLPALRNAPVTLSVSERGRPPAKGVFRRTGLDLVLALLALLAYWQLRRYGGPVVETIQGRLGVDPFLVVAPALGLLAGAVLALRIVPAVAAGVEKLAASARGIIPALGTREIARRPQRYARAALLLSLALAIGLFASAYSRTWLRSQQDQATYAAAADVRVRPSERSGSIPAPQLAQAYRRVDGVRVALPVLTESLDVSRSSGETTLLALDAARAPGVVNFRPDLATRPLAPLLAPLAAARRKLAALPLPGRPARIELEARATSADIRFHGRRVPAFLFRDTRPTLFLVVKDADGLLYRLPAGLLPSDGERWRTVIDLSSRLSDGSHGPPSYPLELVALELQTNPAFQRPIVGRLAVLRLATSDREAGPLTSVPVPPVRWAADASQPENLDRAPRVLGVAPKHAFLTLDFDTGSFTSFFSRTPVTFTVTPGANAPVRTIPAIVTDRFRAETGTGAGATVPLAAAGRGVALRVDTVVHGFPPLPPTVGGAIVDLQSFLVASYLADGTIYEPTEWWIEAAPGRVQEVGKRLADPPYSSSEVFDRVGRADKLANDPVSLGISGALLLGFAAATVFAVIGFAVSAAISASERATEFAVLRSLGVSARQLSASLAIEGGLLIGLALAVGTALGVGLAWLVLPFVALTGEGGLPYPDVLVVFPWATAAWLEAGLVVALVAVVVVELHVLGRMRLAPALRTGEDR
jgi:hypothetical protein